MEIVGGLFPPRYCREAKSLQAGYRRCETEGSQCLEEGNPRESRLSPDNVEKLDEVQAAFTERDRIIAELKPIIADLEKKLMEAEKILEKYG